MTPTPYRNRIVEHVTVKAGTLTPHPQNYRRHPARQRRALLDSLDAVGFARSLVGVRLPDGRIQLIDGHLRAELDPDQDVVVELLDVSPVEARQLLLTLDPLAGWAEPDESIAQELARLTETDSETLRQLWDDVANADPIAEPAPEEGEGKEQWLILVTCDSESRQVELLDRFQKEGLSCKALFS